MAQSSPYVFDIYQPRNPKASAYYKCVENHFEELEQAWDVSYSPPPPPTKIGRLRCNLEGK